MSAFTSDLDSMLPNLDPETRNPFNISSVEITPEIVYEELGKLTESCAPNPDNISSIILRKCSDALAEPLCHEALPERWYSAKFLAIIVCYPIFIKRTTN